MSMWMILRIRPCSIEENVPKKKHLVRKRWMKDDLNQVRAHPKGKTRSRPPERIRRSTRSSIDGQDGLPAIHGKLTL